MLLNMHIKNIALIDELDIDFSEGLNILTGETGAGKSIIVGSLGIGLGGKFSKDILRDEENDGIVELAFSIESEFIRKQLDLLSVEPSAENEILISRKLTKTRCINRINDITVTTAKVKQVAEVLINLHAQHEQQTLLQPAKHLLILDSFSETIREKKAEVSQAYAEYIKVKSKLESMSISESERKKQQDYIAFEIDEIEAACLISGEDSDLEALYKKINSSKDIIETAGEVYEITGYENSQSAGNQISRAYQSLKALSVYDDSSIDLINVLQDIDNLMNDFNRELGEYMKDMEFDPECFKETEERLDLINGLKAKYGRTIEDILVFKDEEAKKLEELITYDETLRKLSEEEKTLFDILVKKSNELTKERKKQSKELCAVIKNALSMLNFNQVLFSMKFEESPNYSSNGHDNAVFMISTNIGEPERPLNEVASGGELSRVMLAIKSCLANEEDTPTLVFDEVDVGISGITAQKVAKMMSKIAKNHQVISITHLPQIAAMADWNYLINKKVENNKTITEICKLDYEGSILEIARLLGGENITDKVKESAVEMKGLADREKLY